MIKFVIVEDNDLHSKRTENIIISYMMANNYEFEIKKFSDYNNNFKHFVDNCNDNLIFILDLELENSDGLDVARHIRNINNNWISPIIFLTVHKDKYITVYKQKLQILDFISKDCDIEMELENNLNICMNMLNNTKSYRFTYRNVDYSVPYSKINYIQRDGRKTKIVSKYETYYQNLSVNLIKDLLPSYFKISSKGIIINIKNVYKINWTTSEVIFKDGSKGYLVSINHKKEFIDYEIG